MDILVQQAKQLSLLPDLDTKGFGTGSLPLGGDTKLRYMGSFSEIANIVSSGIPETGDLSGCVKDIYNQGATASCVAYSTAAMQSIFECFEHKAWMNFDANECYLANGGDGVHGVPTAKVLQWEQDVGMRRVDISRRYRIGSYAFVDPSTDSGIDVIKAAITVNRPCVLALLLPKDFLNGDSNGYFVTNSYHEVCIVGYNKDKFNFVNSWGKGYGNAGFGSIPWAFLQPDEQKYFVYAYTAIDEIETELEGFFSVSISIN